MKRPTDNQLRRRVAKARGMNPKHINFDTNSWEWECGGLSANWLESLDAAVKLLEQARKDDLIACWEVGVNYTGTPYAQGDNGIFEDTTLCRAAVRAWLAATERK